MSEHLINGQVIPYKNGRKSHNTAAWRDATDLEMSQAQQIQDLEDKVSKLHEANQAMLETLKWIADQTYDPWTNGAEAQRHAIFAIAKGEQQ